MNKFKRILSTAVTVTTISWSIGLGTLIPLLPVKAAAGDISTVLLADQDTTGFGLDGRDFAVQWTPDPATPTGPTGYSGTRIFIVPNATALTAGNVLTNGCGGNPCQDRGFLSQYQANQFMIPMSFATDSVNTAWNAATSYKACVLVDAGTDQLLCSNAMTPTSESADNVPDTNPPSIFHKNAYSYITETNLTLYAGVLDDQTTTNNFVTNLNGASVEIFHDIAQQNTLASGGNAELQAGTNNIFRFVVNNNLARVIKYYLKVRDKAGKIKYFTNSPTVDTDPNATKAQADAAAFTVNPVATGTNTVSGRVLDSSGTGINNAFVSLGGLARAGVTTDGTGAYSFTNNIPNGSYDITASAIGYRSELRTETVIGNKTGINITLNQGTEVQGTTAAGAMKPHKVFSGPPDDDHFAPLFSASMPIRVGFDQALNAQNINDFDPTNAGSNVYLSYFDANNTEQKVAGIVTYCANQAATGCTALPAMDTNVVLFAPTTALTANTMYTLVITNAVTSEAGQSIEGNRVGGGYELRFTTQGAAIANFGEISATFGMGGASMPPFVESMNPAPGIGIAPNAKVTVTFNEALQSATINSTNIKIFARGSLTPITLTSVALDSNATSKVVTITPVAGQLVNGTEYELRVLGAVASARGVPMRNPDQAAGNAFTSSFRVSGSDDNTAPTLFNGIAATNVATNEGCLSVGFSEAMDPSTFSATNVTLQRGSSTVSARINYNPGDKTLCVTPDAAFAPSTNYTITFAANGVKDLAGVALATQTISFATSATIDTTAPSIREARCDDFSCSISFSAPMNNAAQTDTTNWTNSVLNKTNWTVRRTSGEAQDLNSTNWRLSTMMDPQQGFSLKIENVTGLAAGNDFRITPGNNVKDRSGNALPTTAFNGKAEDSKQTFGSFGGSTMFGPPTAAMSSGSVGGGGGGGEFKPMGFGNFTAEQFMFGQADMAFPFNTTAGQDVNVFQVRFNPGQALQNDDQIVLTFPSGTTVTNAVPDTLSPFYTDFNEDKGTGTVGFDAAGLSADGVDVDNAARTVTVQLAITGTTGANDAYTIDLRKITNPTLPKGPDTGGYTVGIKVKRAGQVVVNKTSMPYFIQQGGSRSITVKIYAGAAPAGTAGANGSLSLFGGGPSGPMDKTVTLTNGITTAADGTAIGGDAGIVYSSLSDGCYFIGTQPIVTLNNIDYFGQDRPDQICVNSATPTQTKTIVLTSSQAQGAAVELKVKFSGAITGDVDIFAGGPGRFVVKTVTNPAADTDYSIFIPQNGTWFVGWGPALAKGTSGGKKKVLTVMPPPPMELIVTGLSTITAGFNVPPGVAFDAQAKRLTYTTANANKAVSGTVTDGTSGLNGVNVFMHRQGFGAPAFGQTAPDGTFTLNISDYGAYEIGAFSDGLPPTITQIEVKANDAANNDGNANLDIYFKGKLVTLAEPLVLKLLKAAYTISGKLLDASNNPISGAPIFATNATGTPVFGGVSGTDGSYSIFVDAGVWTVRAELPPSKTDLCGTFSKEVTVSALTGSQSNQNITPTGSTCVTLSGTMTIGGTAKLNAPLMVQEWNATTNQPVTGGVFRPSSTDSTGAFSVKVAQNKTYRLHTWDSSTGEIGVTQVVTTADVPNISLTNGTTATITFAFTNGTSSMEGFVEVKKSDDKFTRAGKPVKGLDSNVTFTMKEGTYNYFVDVFGVGKFNGTVATGATARVDLSSTTLITVSGNVKDGNTGASNNLPGTLVEFKGSDGTIRTATTDANGDYSVKLKTGSYTVSPSLSNYLPGQAGVSASFTANTTAYNIGGATETRDISALTKSDKAITGTIFKSDGTTPVTTGMVSATKTDGTTVAVKVDPQTGIYSLPVSEGSWTVKAVAPLHDKTTKASAVTVAASDVPTQNITLTADATREQKSANQAMSANVGGSLNDMGNSGVQISAGPGVLTTGTSTVTLAVEKTFTAPDTESLRPLGDASFDISATIPSSTTTETIKDLSGNAEIQLSYANLLTELPSGVSEADLKLVYYSPEKDSYVPVEGGFTVDPTNNTITGQVSHFTSFMIVYAPVTAAGSTGDKIAPTAPTNLKATSSDGKVTLTWTDPNVADLLRLHVLRNGGDNAPISGVTYKYVDKGKGTFVDTDVTVGKTYKYIVQAEDTSGNRENNIIETPPVTVVAAAAAPTTPTAPAAPVLTTPPATTIPPATTEKTPAPPASDTPSGTTPATPATPNEKVKKSAAEFKLTLNTADENTLTEFVTNGTSQATVKLGSGERLAVVRDILETLGRASLRAIEQISAGEKPTDRNLAKEQAQVNKALPIFQKMLGVTRNPNFKNTNEDLAWNTLMYRIRFDRDLKKEQKGIVRFKKVMGKNPSSPLDWAAVRAYGYKLAK